MSVSSEYFSLRSYKNIFIIHNIAPFGILRTLIKERERDEENRQSTKCIDKHKSDYKGDLKSGFVTH